MTLNIIKELKAATPEKRKKIMLRMRQKNLIFFKKYDKSMGFSKLLETADVSAYEINFTPEFLDIIEKKTGHYCHPPGDLLGQAARLARTYHSDWIDVMNPFHTNYGDSRHSELIKNFLLRTYRGCSEINTRVLAQDFRLPEKADGKLHSGPVVFLGIFHGLHILSFLNNVAPSHISLIEPDIESFLLSCYFVDYKALAKRFQQLNINVGQSVSVQVLNDFFEKSNITARVWVRFLPVYHDAVFNKIIEQVKLRWAEFEIHVPFEREEKGLVNGFYNIRQGYRYCRPLPENVGCENVAVVGSGPSLVNELEWLRKNRQHLIIICATSSGLLLTENNIEPDFLTYLELYGMDRDIFQLDCPTLIHYKTDPEYIRDAKLPILFAPAGRPNSVDFTEALAGTSPTSANVAMSLACLLKPQSIFLVGLDLSAKDTKQGVHAAQQLGGGNQEFYSDYGYEERTWVTVEQCNFPESEGALMTHSFFWAAKQSLEETILKSTGTTVYNLSDGVLIEGTLPCRSADLTFEGQTNQSVEQVLAVFHPLQQADWRFYSEPGQILLENMKQEILTLFKEQFIWQDFIKNIDQNVEKVMQKYVSGEPEDLRLYVYYKLINDAVTEWYRAMIYTRSLPESEQIYENGRSALQELLKNLQWPEELSEA